MCEKELHIEAEVVTGVVTVYMSGPLPINIFKMLIGDWSDHIDDVRFSRVIMAVCAKNAHTGIREHVDGHAISFCTKCFDKLDIKSTHDEISICAVGVCEGEKKVWFTLKSQEKGTKIPSGDW